MFESEVVKIPPGTFCVQVSEEMKVPLTETQFIGPYGIVLKFTGLDCSVVALSKVDSSFKFKAWVFQFIAVIIIALSVLRCYTLFQLKGNSMSIQWAESGMFAFMGVQSVECAYCIFSWTKKEFISNYLEKLEHLRLLRLKNNENLDNYSRLHLKVFVWTLIHTTITMVHSITCAIQEKVILSGDRIYPIIYFGMPCLTLFVCIHVSVFLNCYYIVNSSLIREIEYFNLELGTARKTKQLHKADVFIKFSHRHAELISLVRKANKSLGAYTFTTPISMFNACINGVYMFFTFRDYLPSILNVILNLNVFATLFMTYFSLRPASRVQFHLEDTSRILMECQEFENSEDSDIINTYHIMMKRSLNHNARLRVLGGIPIYPTTFNTAMFFIPSLGTLLSFVKKSLHTYGLEMEHH
uniref:Gustatory receptor n=1 Tax=Caenorhabditis tropicalis TaxID=1561998 RepID=A0A1I7TYU8_9PELO